MPRALLSYGIVALITTEAEPAAPSPPAPSIPPSRRDRVRNATLAEIKALAWAQIAESGAAALSLRAIARAMGMTSSALYRYFTSREQLLSALAQDGFASLADHLEAVEPEPEETEASGSGSDRFMRVVRAYRRWALDHPTEYALTFGSPVPGLECHVPEVKAEMERGVAVLLRVMIAGLRAGLIQPPPLAGPDEPALRAKLALWGSTVDEELSPEALGACMFAWTQLHGAISVELFGHMPPDLMPADELFEYQMREVLRTIGCQLSS
ncbi:MAG TPA: TetR/AcrR family transcriptional regulator [Acidimicrobiales bacterium]|nr:TetR/AcrR family transcriptional regulator [Acidimicrobiales bacterium]